MVMVLRAVAVAARCSTRRGAGSAQWIVVATVLLAIALGVSRKTAGGVALIPAATGVALVLGSALRRIAARGAWPRAHVPLASTILHLLWSALGLALVAQSLPPGGGDLLRWVYAAIAGLAAVLLLAACFADPDPPSAAVRGDVTP
jgi:peptidoglycan/LPS O-acetylase OafA/YrhL